MDKDPYKILNFASSNGEPEIFETIQGEGRHIGEPATFMRLSGCNLQCVWCDTPYTWNWTGTDFEHNGDQKYVKEEQRISLTVGEAVNRISGQTNERIVITGGEPLMQQNQITNLIVQLRSEYPEYRFELETNGTIKPNPALIDLVDQFNVSVKLQNSGMPEKKRLKSPALETYAQLPKADFKFVIDTPEDLEQVLALAEQYDIPATRIYLMPQGINQEQQTEKEQWVAELCKQYKFNFTPRLHIALWGDERGV